MSAALSISLFQSPMKNAVLMLTLFAAVSAYSQGTVNFNNAVSASNKGPISYDGSGPVPAGPVNGAGIIEIAPGSEYGGIHAKAALYGGAPGTAPSEMAILVPAVGFKSGTSAGYVDVGTFGTRTVQGIPGGSPADFVIKAWDVGAEGYDTYEAAVQAVFTSGRLGYFGSSIIYHVPALGGAGSPPSSPANLPGLTAFMISVPEPSMIGLGLLGVAAGIVFLRRRQ